MASSQRCAQTCRGRVVLRLLNLSRNRDRALAPYRDLHGARSGENAYPTAYLGEKKVEGQYYIYILWNYARHAPHFGVKDRRLWRPRETTLH